MSTFRDFFILQTVARYYTVTRAQISALCVPNDHKDGRITRKRLDIIWRQGLVNKTQMQVVNPGMGAPAPVYYPSRKGCELLATEFKDPRYLQVCTQTPNWQHLYHWTQIAQFHIILDQALALQQEVQAERWISEWDVANPEAKEPEKRYRLFTILRDKPRLVCAPDAGFLLSYRGYRKGYYLELDRATSGIQQIAVSKTPGVAEMAAQCLHLRHFPDSNVDSFSVLLVTTTPARRDALRNAIACKSGAALWKFVVWSDLKPETLLHEPIFYSCTADGAPLVKRPQGGAA